MERLGRVVSPVLLLLAVIGCGGPSSQGAPDGAPDAFAGDQSRGSDALFDPDGTVVNPYRDGDTWLLRNGEFRVRFDAQRLLHIERMIDGEYVSVVKGAEAWIELRNGTSGALEYMRSSEMTLKGVSGGREEDLFPLGGSNSERLRIAFGSEISTQPLMTWTVRLVGPGRLVFELELNHNHGRPVVRLCPFSVDGNRGGALWLGQDPKQHVVLDNGSDIYLDFVARAFAVGKGNSLMFPPGNVSNWSLGVSGPDPNSGLAAGFLSFDHGVGLVALDADKDVAQSDGGRTSFTRLEGFVVYEPERPLGTVLGGGPLTESFYLDLSPVPLTTSPMQPGATVVDVWQRRHMGLEGYAQAFADWNRKQVANPPLTGWNSWGGGGGSGGLGQGIDEPTILKNLDYMVEDFQGVGMNHFLIDDGWQLETGDWESHPEKFPSHEGQEGMRWMADQIRAKGLVPGLWIAPFWVKRNSKLAQEHPDWLADINEYGGLLIKENDATLDLTNPEVLEWLDALFTKVCQTWGYKVIKLDFSYFALFATNLHDPNVTASEAYHNALKRIRKIMGDDGYLIGISATGLFFDVADGGRTTLDNMPWWGDGEKQGIKQTVLTASHRSFLNRLWNNHPDLIFFREDYGLTWKEAKAFLDFATIQGGILKLGETYEAFDQNPEWLEAVRHRLPGVALQADPQDVYAKKYPEAWAGKLGPLEPWETSDRNTWAVALFNWGVNEELPSGTALGEQSREVVACVPGMEGAVEIDTLDLSCRRLTEPFVRRTLAPRTSALLLVSKEDAHSVRLLATNRHWAGGMADVLQESWAGESGGAYEVTLSTPGTMEGVLIQVPSGFSLQVMQPAGATVQAACDGVMRVQFVPTGPQTVLVVKLAQDQ